MDFHSDATADGCRLKFLNVNDEHSRLCLAIRVGRRCKAKDVVALLEELTSLYPAPAFNRGDNGPESIAQALRYWCEASTNTSTAYKAPGSLWETVLLQQIADGLVRGLIRNRLLISLMPATRRIVDTSIKASSMVGSLSKHHC